MSPETMNAGTISADLRGRFGAFTLEAAFDIPAEGLTAITGPSGAGKTTLLRCIAGLDRAKGRLSVGNEVWQGPGRFIPPHRRGVGYVFQEPSLFPHLSLRANLRYGMDRAGRREGLDFEEVTALLGLEPLLGRSPLKLSGGERQRGAIARALLSRPRLLLMDEPTAALDAEAKSELLPYLERLHRALRLPVLYVSHDAVEVERLADRVLTMRAGRVEAVSNRPEGVEARLDALLPSDLRRLAAAALRSGLG